MSRFGKKANQYLKHTKQTIVGDSPFIEGILKVKTKGKLMVLFLRNITKNTG